jgi:YD repeat-containing protein
MGHPGAANRLSVANLQRKTAVQVCGYDPNGNRTGLNLVGVGLFTYTFDELSRLATAQKPGNQLYTMSYDADSRRTTMMLGNGTTRKYGYDARSQLTTQIEMSSTTNMPVVTIVDGYDPVGNRITRNLDGSPITWTYDDLYRLTGQQKAGQVCTYTMDGVGNLKTMWEGGSFPKTFSFDAADRLVTMMEGAALTTYSWTGYGALASEVTGNQTTGYAYNGQDQLVGVTPPSGFPSTYSFDGDGMRRTAQEGNVLPTTMVWDGSDYLLLHGPSSDQVVLTLESEIVNCGGKDLLTDPLGSLVREISAGASLSSLFQFYPYGAPVGASPANAIPFQFVGAYGYYTDSAERDYVRARELYKKLGRWMQVDAYWPGKLVLRGDVPRRICVDQFSPAEMAIFNAVSAVEMTGADVRLTDAVNLLYAARALVADYVDSKIETLYDPPEWEDQD